MCPTLKAISDSLYFGERYAYQSEHCIHPRTDTSMYTQPHFWRRCTGCACGYRDGTVLLLQGQTVREHPTATKKQVLGSGNITIEIRARLESGQAVGNVRMKHQQHIHTPSSSHKISGARRGCSDDICSFSPIPSLLSGYSSIITLPCLDLF